MKPSLPPKPAGWSNASNGTTPPSTAAGSIWRSPSSASYRPNASTDASPTNKPSSTKSPPGSTTAIPDAPKPTGTSQPPTHASNSATCTLQSDRIRRLGQIVGNYQTTINGVSHGFLYNPYSGTPYTTLDAPGSAQGTFANGINGAGQIVGSYIDA